MSWIKTCERLPKEYERVLIIIDGEYINIRSLSGEQFCSESGCVDLEDVAHWMPLPEMPQD